MDSSSPNTPEPSADEMAQETLGGDTRLAGTVQSPSPVLNQLDRDHMSPSNSAPQSAKKSVSLILATKVEKVKPEHTKVRGGRAWRQMQTDAETVRMYGLQLVKMLGGSSVSTVYLAEDSTTPVDGKPKKIALKVMDWTSVLGNYQRSIYPELIKRYMTMPQHPNLVSILNTFVDGRCTMLVCEWCSLGNLAQALGPQGCLARGVTEQLSRQLISQVCQGLEFLQSNGLPHGRLTCENILLGEGFVVKLCDYGYPPSTCSNCTDDDRHLLYRAPELLRGRPTTGYAADIWSLGVVLYAMLHAKMPYTVKVVLSAERGISLPPLDFKTSLSFPGRLMLKRLLTFTPLFRPSLTSVLADPWMLTRPKPPVKYHLSCHHDQGPADVQPGLEDTADTGQPSLLALHSSSTAAPDSKKTAPASTTTTTTVKPATTSAPTSDTTTGRRKSVVICPAPLAASGSPPSSTLPLSLGYVTLTRGPLSMTPTQLKWQEAFNKYLCPECHAEKAAQPGRRGSGPGQKPPRGSYARHRGKLCPRVASMFARFHPCPPDKAKFAMVPSGILRSTEVAKKPSNTEVADQLVEFLKYSERMRARFFRFYGGDVPVNCKEYPLPPVLIHKAQM